MSAIVGLVSFFGPYTEAMTTPAKPPPWRDAGQYGQCKKKQCCVCMTVADVNDLDNDEMGFATSGTLRRLEHVAAAAGFEPRRIWQNVDEALTRQFIAEQRRFQAEANGAPLSRWATLFSADVGFAADGRAYLYENLLMPNWKRPGYFWHEAVDRAVVAAARCRPLPRCATSSS